MSEETKQINVPSMCIHHQRRLVVEAKYSPKDPWQSLMIMTNIVLFQAAAADKKTHEKLNNDITKIDSLGCLACYKPTVFGEITRIAKSRDLGKLKEYGQTFLELRPADEPL